MAVSRRKCYPDQGLRNLDYDESVIRCALLVWSACLLTAGEPVPPARLIWNVPGANVLGAPSLDGKWITCVDPSSGNLATLDIASGKLRLLTEKGSNAAGQFAYFSVPSRDGRRVAYAWFNEAGFYDLRVADLAAVGGGGTRVLFRNEEAGFVQPSSWTPDNKQVLTLFFRKDNISQIALVDAETGFVRVLKSLNWVYPKKMEISPDGRWIVYDTFAGDKPGPRDIYLLAVDGSRETKLVDSPGEDLFPSWSPDGSQIVFASDRSGSMDAWALRVSEAGQAVGEPRLVKKDLKQFLPMGVTSAGDLFYGVRSGATDIEIGDANERRTVLQTRTPGENLAPAWSRDGKKLAYLSRRGSENFGTAARVIVVQDLETGSERDLAARLAHVEALRWSPDGEWLLASGSDGKGRAGLFKVRVKDGTLRTVAVDEAGGLGGVIGAWKPDGSVAEPGEKGTRALAISADGKRMATATAGQILVAGDEPRQWTLDGVTWLEWAGSRLLAARGGRAYEMTGKGALPLNWKNYDGGPLSVHPDGHTVALGVGRTRHEVWVMEHVFAPSDHHRP